MRIKLTEILNMKKPDKIFYLYLFIFTSLYIFTSSGNSVFDSDASLARYELTKSIAEKFDLSIPAGYGVRGIDGRDYSWSGLGYSIFSLPFYFAGKLTSSNPGLAVSLINQIVGVMTVILIFRFLLALGYSRRASFLIGIFYGLGTIAWPIAKQPFDNGLETFFVLLSIYYIYSYFQNTKTTSLIFSSFGLGFAFITRPTAILVTASIFFLLYFII